MSIRKKATPAQPFRVFSFILLICLILFPSISAFAEKSDPDQELENPAEERLDDELWSSAETALEKEDYEKAAYLFENLYNRYPDSEKAEEALWQAASLQKRIASESEKPNWDKPRSLFRRYVMDYPESPRAPQAFFEVATAYYNMRFYREALTYFGLMIERFPDSSLIPQTRYWKARTLIKIGRLNESKEVFLELTEAKDTDLRIKAAIGLGDIQSADENYTQALKQYEKVLKEFPLFYLKQPEILKAMGIANLRLKNEETGRKLLFQYLNLAERSADKAEIFFFFF